MKTTLYTLIAVFALVSYSFTNVAKVNKLNPELLTEQRWQMIALTFESGVDLWGDDEMVGDLINGGEGQNCQKDDIYTFRPEGILSIEMLQQCASEAEGITPPSTVEKKWAINEQKHQLILSPNCNCEVQAVAVYDIERLDSRQMVLKRVVEEDGEKITVREVYRAIQAR